MKFGQAIEHNKIFYLKNHSENETGGLVSNLLLFLKKALNEVNASGPQLSFNIL